MPGRQPPPTHSTYIVSSGQTSSGLVENVNYNEIVLSGGAAFYNVVSSGGRVYVSSGGVTTSDVVYSSGFEVISVGGSASKIGIGSGGVVEGGGAVFSGIDEGLLTNVLVEGGGSNTSANPDTFIMAVQFGGQASAVTVTSGGALDVYISGSAVSTTVIASCPATAPSTVTPSDRWRRRPSRSASSTWRPSSG